MFSIVIAIIAVKQSVKVYAPLVFFFFFLCLGGVRPVAKKRSQWDELAYALYKNNFGNLNSRIQPIRFGTGKRR